MRRTFQRHVPTAFPFSHLVSIIILCVSSGFAQSRDVSYPTPVGSNEITGRIAPRDIGDARLTRHFYTFTGLEGDLIMTVESTDFNGDVDLFTAGSLLPLTKVTLYAGSEGTKATKSVYLRKEEPLVLRVEGRSAGDGEAVYHIRFEGAFSPSSRQLAQTPEPSTPTLSETGSRDKTTRRVNSIGARIEEPATETAAETPPAGEATPTSEKAPSSTATRRTTTPRRNRPARSSARTNTRRTNTPDAKRTGETARADESRTGAPSTENSTAEKTGANEPDTSAPAKPKTARPRPTRRGRRNVPATEQSATAVPTDSPDGSSTAPLTAPASTSPRLIIVTRDGETLERDMSTVRRVTVENNQIVVTGKDGRITRQPMANVVRMSIEP